MDDLVISLPKEAVLIRNDVAALEIINVVGDKTNMAATENLKLVNQQLKAFREACEPERIRLRTPLDNYLALKKEGEDTIEMWIDRQKKSIGAYAQELIQQENERRLIEQQKKDDEERARIEKLNAERAEEAAKNGTEAKVEEFVPVQQPVMMEQALVKTEFVTANVKLKPNATITDKVLFMQTLVETGNTSWINLIFDKVNQSKLNEFCKATGINGRDKLYPGLSVEMVADIRTR